MLIYILTNLVNGKYYVGKTKMENLHHYLSQKRCQVRKAASIGRTDPIISAMRKYGIENFSSEILSQTDTHEQLCELEKLWILALDCRNPKIGYNIMAGGEHVYRKPCAEETKRKIGLANKGRKPVPYIRTEKHRQQISERVKGKHYGKGIPHPHVVVSDAGREVRRQCALAQWQDPARRPDKNRRVSIS